MRMRWLMSTLLGGLALLLLGPLLTGCATEAMQQREAIEQRAAGARTRADHEAVAAWYEREAAAARENAARHQRMLDAYRPGFGGRSAGISTSAGILRHCENLVRRYEGIADDALALAKLHRQVAGETKE